MEYLKPKNVLQAINLLSEVSYYCYVEAEFTINEKKCVFVKNENRLIFKIFNKNDKNKQYSVTYEAINDNCRKFIRNILSEFNFNTPVTNFSFIYYNIFN